MHPFTVDKVKNLDERDAKPLNVSITRPLSDNCENYSTPKRDNDSNDYMASYLQCPAIANRNSNSSLKTPKLPDIDKALEASSTNGGEIFSHDEQEVIEKPSKNGIGEWPKEAGERLMNPLPMKESDHIKEEDSGESQTNSPTANGSELNCHNLKKLPAEADDTAIVGPREGLTPIALELSARLPQQRSCEENELLLFPVEDRPANSTGSQKQGTFNIKLKQQLL